MNTKKTIRVICLLFVISSVTGCALPFRKPEAQRQPDQTPIPQQQEIADSQERQEPDTKDMANRVASIAADVPGVNNVVAVVISNLAMVGITLDQEDNANSEVEIKKQVAKRIEDTEPSIVNAYVSTNPDILRQLNEISSGVARGEPISGFFDQLTQVLQRMRAEDSED